MRLRPPLEVILERGVLARLGPEGGWFQRRVECHVIVVVDDGGDDNGDEVRRNARNHAAERIRTWEQERPLFEIAADEREHERVDDDDYATEKR